MHNRILSISLVTVIWTTGALGAQDNFVSPEVHPDRSVTFRLLAPNAREVMVQGIDGVPATALARSDQGIWSVTVGPLPPELYSYVFSVDGAEVLDPRNRQIKKWLRCNSAFEVPGDPPRLHELQSVPHGTLHYHTYDSKAVGGPRGVYVYTPPGYAPSSGDSYPVVYLMHGYGDDESAWNEVGRAHRIADNLLAQAKIQPMIIVMPNGHPVPILLERGFDDYAAQNLERLDRDYFEDLMPFVRSQYRVRTGAEHQAIVGLSMGGGQSLGIGLRHLSDFGWIAGFSSSAPQGALDEQFSELLAKKESSPQVPRLLWIGCGKDDFLLKRNQAFVQWLEAKNIVHTWHLSEGGHAWPVWRRYLAELLPQLFR